MAASFPSQEQRGQDLLHCWIPTPYRQDLAYRVVGSGAPVVFLHGLWDSSSEWKRAFDHFSPHYRLYAPDLPGHGQSPARLPWRLREIAVLLAAWMRALQTPPATIVGHSMGGALAIILAAAEPELVNRLVLVNTVGLPIQRPFLRRLTNTGQGIANHQILRYTSRYGDSRLLQSVASWQATNEVLTCDLRPDITCIHCPTLIIWGIRDPLLPTQSAVALQRAIQDAELVMLPNVRHHPSRQVPEFFDQILEEFLGRGIANDQPIEKTGD